MPSFNIKDPGALLDYPYDFTNWLVEGETIVSKTITAQAGITVESSAIDVTGKAVVVWLSGGTAHHTYLVTCAITTSAGRVDERTRRIAVQDQ